MGRTAVGGTVKSAVCPLMIGAVPMLLLTVACAHPLSASDLLGRLEVKWDVSVGSPHNLHGQLRSLAALGYLHQSGTEPSGGAARKLWMLTPAGEETLDACWHELMWWQAKRESGGWASKDTGIFL